MNKLDIKISNIIKHYKKLKVENPDTWVEFCAEQKNLYLAIQYAALATNKLKKRNPHQYRLKQTDLQVFSELLLSLEVDIAKAKTFDELFLIISKRSVKGIGELTKYDTAIRIAAFLKLNPEKIYLHAGTKKGAINLLNKRITTKTISKDELPNIFQTLSCAEIEDILCIYKDRLKSLDTA
ncbi:MAG: hypothetical protein Q8L07_07995 [Sediminibacterium sp.]|nr:hypothetical protein [Sediminibacterium sp.]